MKASPISNFSLLFLVFATACRTTLQIPKHIERNNRSSLPIDGDWINQRGLVFRIQQGEMYTINEGTGGIEAGSIIAKDIMPSGRGTYSCKSESHVVRTGLVDYGPGEIRVVAEDKLALITYPNPVTGFGYNEIQLTSIRRFTQEHLTIYNPTNIKQVEEKQTSEHDAWVQAVRTNNTETFRRFISKFPLSPHIKDANSKIEEIKEKDEKILQMEETEDVALQKAVQFGLGNRFAVRSIVAKLPNGFNKGSCTIRSVNGIEGAISATMDYPKDSIYIAGTGFYIPDGDGSIIRFANTVNYGGHIFEGNERDPLVFLQTTEFGLVYITGSGIVHESSSNVRFVLSASDPTGKAVDE